MIVDTIEEENKLIVALWNKVPFIHKVIMVTYVFLYIYFIVVCLFSYDEFETVHENKNIAMSIFWLILFTVFVNILPFMLHYLSISTYGILHILYMLSTISLVLALWLLLTTYDRRVINPSSYKDPYSIAIYLLLYTFSILWLIGSLSKLNYKT